MAIDNSDKILSFTENRQLRDDVIAALQNVSNRGNFRRELKLNDRFSGEHRVVTACFEHPGGGFSKAQVMLVNIASDGASVIFGGYMHPSTVVTLMLTNQSEFLTPLSGSITFCDFLVNKYHAMNIRWHRPIDPREFIDPSQWIGKAKDDQAQSTIELKGNLLYLNSDNMELKLIQMMLSDSQIEIVWAEDIGSALDLLHQSPFDVVFVDAGLRREMAVQDIARIRSEVHRGPIVIGVQDGIQSHISELRRLGYKHFIQKPYEQETMLSVLGTAIMQSNDPAGGTSPIYSDVETSGQSRDDAREWIADYISTMGKQAKMLEQSIKIDDVDLALKICNTIHATGIGYGFPLLSEVALEAVTVLNASCSAKESRRELMRLIGLVARLNVNPSGNDANPFANSSEAA